MSPMPSHMANWSAVLLAVRGLGGMALVLVGGVVMLNCCCRHYLFSPVHKVYLISVCYIATRKYESGGSVIEQ